MRRHKQGIRHDTQQYRQIRGIEGCHEFDKALIELFGINMTDARITRYEALSSIEEAQCARKAAELFGSQRGVPLLSANQS